MHDSAFHWFENIIDNGATILKIFWAFATSEPTSLVATTANVILSIIRNVGAIKYIKPDFYELGRDAAVLAVATYRLDRLKPPQREQHEQLQDMLSTLKDIAGFVESCIQRTAIRQVTWMQTDRKVIKWHRRKVADILLRLEFSLLAQSASATNEDNTYHPTEGPSFTQGPHSPHRQPVVEQTTGRPSFVNSVHSQCSSHHHLPQRHRKHGPTYTHPPDQCPFHPLHMCVGTQHANGVPSTIIYDYSYHTTHHGSHNYQGQNVNQGGSSHGPVRMHPQNIYMKHFNGNEIHCWTPSANGYDLTSLSPDNCTSPFELRDDLYQPEFYAASGISDASLDHGGGSRQSPSEETCSLP